MADTARQTSEAFGDLEFEYNLKQLLDKDPIAALGFDPAKASYSVPQGDKYGTKYSREEDTLFYGPDTGSSKDILVHEFRHRGHQLLRNEIEKNPESFAKKYGQDVVDFLTGEFSETEGKLYPGDRQEEFRTELSDNLEATYNKPRPSEEKLLQGIKDSLGDSANLFNDEELMALAVKNYVKNVDNTGYVKDTTELVTKEDQEKYKNILTKVRQAASDILQQRKGYDQGGTVGKVLDFLTSPLTGDYRKKKPASVQMAELGLEVATPLGTVNDIQAELEKDDPSYAKIAGMAGLELLGPAAGAVEMAAKAGNKGLLQKILESFKKDPEAEYDPVITGSGEGPRVTEFSDYDYTNNPTLEDFGYYIDNPAKWGNTDWAKQKQAVAEKYAREGGKSAQKLLSGPQTAFLGIDNKKPLYLSTEFLSTLKGANDEVTDISNPKYVDLKESVEKEGFLPDQKGNKILIGINHKGEAFIMEGNNRVALAKEFGAPSVKAEVRYYNGAEEVDGPHSPQNIIKHARRNPTAAEDLGFTEDAYHYTRSEKIDKDKFDPDLAISNWNRLGIHVGNKKAARDRFVGTNDLEEFPEEAKGTTLPLKVRTDKPLMFSEEVESEYSVLNKLKALAESRGLDPLDWAEDLRRQLAEEGYTHIPYINEVENEGTISYIMLTDRPEGSDAVMRSRFAKFDPSKKDKPELGMSKGGKVGNMNMQKQMSLFEYGGIADDGMTKDPVSGNNIPPGSLAKEVRDDIPAMLSEGEYVVPADVLRYYGVNFFENLRGQAKQGLQNMEQNGRIGGTPMTQQDVARNMQQPMTPAPVQAAQGAMMQSPMRIKQQTAPQAVGNSGIQQQPVMANKGTMVQGFDEGTTDPRANQYKSGWNPATARMNTPMFQGTSSQLANVAAAAETAEAAEITQFRNHYNQAGESAQVKYTGTTPDNMTVAPGQDDILSKYPLTEEEWLAYKKEMSRSDDGGNGGGETEPTGSSTEWMDGIDWSDKASVKAWVESDDGLGMSKDAKDLASMGGILGAAPQVIQAQDIAKARGIRDYYASIKDEEMVSYLDGKIDEAMEKTGVLTSALDKLGLMTGKTYLKQIMDLDPVVPDNVPGFQIRANRLKQKVAENAEAQKAIDDAIAAKALESAQANQDDGDPFAVTDVNIDRDPMGQGTMTTTYEGIDPGLTTASFEEDPEIDFGVNKGGLMKAPKPKKKTRKYNKGGLAGKK